MTDKQPEALRLADELSFHCRNNFHTARNEAATCLRTQHATITALQERIAELERDAAGFLRMPLKLTPEMAKAGGHANSEWLNDNAPIGEGRYAQPMESVYAAFIAAMQQGEQK